MIYRIEARQRRPSVQIARLLGKALNVPHDELDVFVRFARADKPTKVHTHHIDSMPWRQSFVPKNNLPLQLTALIGREQLLADAASLMRQDDVRLLTLIGPPGIGKTRIAVQLGNEVLLDFPDGVFFVELAAITQADRIIMAIAHTLDISLAGHKKTDESLHVYLYERRLLLILDNFEQILDAAPEIHAVLRTCPQVKVVITSRAPLRIRGERQFPIVPLALPGRVDDLNVRRLTGFAAVQLFVERAKAIQPDFELTTGDAAVVAAICARLDGLPLAIEIAAAQMTILQPEEILERLTGRSLLESRGMVDSDPRHHSLNAAIAWSYQLLEETERAFFRRVGIFVDDCTMEAAQSVCQPEHDLVLMLSKLAGMSLLKREITASGTSRYRMLEVIRQFARQELQLRGEWPALQASHAGYFHTFALEHEESVRSNGQVAGLEQVEHEHNNLLTALDYFITSKAWQKGLELVGALTEFWVYHNHVIVGLHYVTQLLKLTAGDTTLQAGRARVLNGAAMMAYFAGDFPAISPFAEAALTSAQAVKSDRDVARACITLGMKSGGMRNFKAAISFFKQGMQAAQLRGDMPWEMASLLNGLGEVARSQGHYEEALEYYASALGFAEDMGNLWLSAHILDNIGHAAYSQERYDMADDYIRRGIEASITLGDERGVAMCLEKLGGIAIARGQLTFAARLLGAAEALRESKNTPVEGMDAADHQRSVDQLREQLTAEKLDEAWAEGRHLPLPQILAQIL